MNERKSFFRNRTANEIKELGAKRVYSPRGLVRTIWEDLPADKTLELRFQLTPKRFARFDVTGAVASRKCYKHGNVIALEQPKSIAEALECPNIPLAIRARDFEKELLGLKEEEINFVGYSFRPVRGLYGGDGRRRIVPFVWLPEAEKIFAYAETKAGGIDIKPYADSERVKIEGADIICKVPSRTQKKERYAIKLRHVPVDGATERRAVVWSLKAEFESGKEPEHSRYNIRYTWANERENIDGITMYPHVIAAYIAVAGKLWKEQKNLTPMEMNPFALLSRKEAEFYKKLCNNIVIYDPTLDSKDKLRNLHLDEKCILIARSIGTYRHDETMFWDPARDGKLRDYNWSI